MTPHGTAHEYGEDAAIEQPAIQLFEELGWETANLYNEWASGSSTEGRESEKQVVLEARLKSALERLNPHLPPSALDQAVDEVTRDRSRMVPENANRELWRLLRDGVKVKVAGERGQQETNTARIIAREFGPRGLTSNQGATTKTGTAFSAGSDRSLPGRHPVGAHREQL